MRFGHFRASVIRGSVLFEVQSFEVRSFEVRSFDVQSFEVRSFEVRSFEVQSRIRIGVLCLVTGSVADPGHLNTDPDPTFPLLIPLRDQILMMKFQSSVNVFILPVHR